MKVAKLFICLTLGLLALYLISFFVVFDVFSYPTRTSQGWIGPAKRDNPQVLDIGGGYEYQGTSVTAYSIYQPCCWAWLKVNAID